MAEDRDLEKAESVHELSEKNSDSSDGFHYGPAADANEEDLPRTTAPPELVENAIDVPPQGRRGSKSSHCSADSQDTQPDYGHDHQVPTPYRSRSRAQSSTRSVRRDAVKVPRGQRRGLFAGLTIVAEVTNPLDYPRRTKWFLTFVVALAGAAAPMASSIVLPALPGITRDFNSSATTTNLSVSLFMLAMAIFPLWWSSFSETLGRRTVYLSSFALYVVFSAIGGVSVNVGMFLAMRLLSGGAAASVQAVGAGSVSDLWEPAERGHAMGLFYLGPLCGPLLSPIIGGLLAEGLGWRSIQWFLAIFGMVILLFVLFCFPETLKERKSVVANAEAEIAEDPNEKANSDDKAARPTLSRTTTAQSVHVRTKKTLKVLRRSFLDPLRIILLLQFPAVAVCIVCGTVTFVLLYILNVSIQATFSESPYNYTSIIVGLLYLPNSAGYFLTSILGGRWVDKIMAREAHKAGRYDSRGHLQFRPEDRMRENAWLGALLYPAALVVYGWTAEYGVNVAAPLVANFFFGIGSMLIFAMATTMLTEFMPKKASNGVALNNFVRNILGCVGTAVTAPLLRTIGNGWLFTGLAVIGVVSGSLSIWAMKRFGDRWRERMDRRLASVMGD